MKLRWIIAIVAAVFVTFAFKLTSSTPDHQFERENIQQVMQQIFDQHIEERGISTKIVQSSINNYLEQFDPDKIYLLESEVEPYRQLSESRLQQILSQYKNSDFTVYTELNTLIQKAIVRAREIREKLEKDKAHLFKKGKHTASSNNEAYAKTVKELEGRIKDNMVTYIVQQKRRFGENMIMKHPHKTIERYNDHLLVTEEQYLYQDDLGNPLPLSEKENLFVLHVLKALARGLDTQTEVMSPREAYEMRIRLEKGFPGIGVILQQLPQGIYITRLVEGGPAIKSGKIRINDRIIEVNNKPVAKSSMEEVVELLQGNNGSKVKLLLERKVKEGYRYVNRTIPITLTREMIPIAEDRVETSYETVGNGIIGKITLNSFYRGTNGISSVEDVRQAIETLDKQGNMRGLVLDLRENYGGFLTEAVKVAGLFITNGVIVTARYADGQEKVYRDIDSQVAYDGPLIVLTSKATASAAEIVAQALQDYGVALVVGDEQTYGKGTIQSQTVTGDQGTSYFKVTVGKYYAPSGNTPDHKGVLADIVVPSQFTHLNLRDEHLEFANTNDIIAPALDDKLKGVPSAHQDWYLKYYVPTLQARQKEWNQMLPTLRNNSSYRIAHNKNYQHFLKQSGSIDQDNTETTDQSDEEDESMAALRKNFGVEDLQMIEAVNIVKDMIILHQHPNSRNTAQVRK